MSSTNLPSGTATFLYTDIQGSAALWERVPEPMRVAMEQHNAILNESIAAHGGTVYKVIGDAFQAAFPVSIQAVKAAVAIQRKLAKTKWVDRAKEHISKLCCQSTICLSSPPFLELCDPYPRLVNKPSIPHKQTT